MGSLDPISWRKRWVSDFRLILFSFTIRKRRFLFYSGFMNHPDYSVKKKGVVLIFIIRTLFLQYPSMSAFFVIFLSLSLSLSLYIYIYIYIQENDR